MLPIIAIANYLQTGGHGTVGTTIFWGSDANLPASGAPLIAVKETGGRPGWATHNDGRVDQPWFQITVHHASYTTAAEKLALIRPYLEKKNIVIGDLFFLWMSPVSNPTGLTPINNRVRVAYNLETAVRPA